MVTTKQEIVAVRQGAAVRLNEEAEIRAYWGGKELAGSCSVGHSFQSSLGSLSRSSVPKFTVDVQGSWL